MFWNVYPGQMTVFLDTVIWTGFLAFTPVWHLKATEMKMHRKAERHNCATALKEATGWWTVDEPVDKQTTAVIFWMARKEVPLWYPNLLPCIWWTHVPLDHGDSSDLSCNHSGEDMPHGDTPKGQPEVVLVIYTQSHKLLKHLAFRTGGPWICLSCTVPVHMAFEARHA